MPESVALTLTPDEALVLFDWLHRVEARIAELTEHRGEAVALWNLSALLERELVEPFQADYGERVDAARERLNPTG